MLRNVSEPIESSFAIVSDIDGVITFNAAQVGQSDTVIQKLLANPQ